MSLFQVVFGLVVFATTRHAYTDKSSGANDQISDIEPLRTSGNGRLLDVNSTMLRSLVELQPHTPDPSAISLMANAYFEEKRYIEAAELYEQLLTFRPSNADVHNNLGLTLHYLGRSAEALTRLEQGVELDPTNQRLWLTLGFVNSASGNSEIAKSALATAIQLDANSQIGESAAKMLDRIKR